MWTHRLPAERPHLSGLAVSASQVGRILDAADLKPRLVRGRLTRSADPEFFTRAADVCDLCRRCPGNAVVISVDEKTGITTRSRKHPDLPGRPGRRTRREFEYVRHGTASIVAALDVHTGHVLTETITRNDSDTFIGFLPPRTPRSRPSWTQVELFFSTLTRGLLRRGEFDSRDQLAERIDDVVLAHGEHDAKPYRWTYDGSPLKAARSPEGSTRRCASPPGQARRRGRRGRHRRSAS